MNGYHIKQVLARDTNFVYYLFFVFKRFYIIALFIFYIITRNKLYEIELQKFRILVGASRTVLGYVYFNDLPSLLAIWKYIYLAVIYAESVIDNVLAP